MRIAQIIRRAVHRFGLNDQAVAAVEFALIAPFLISLYFGSMEASALFTADRRVNTISATIGDLVSQWDPDDGTLSVSTTLADYFAASQALIFPMSTTGLKQVVTYVQVKSDGTTVIIWSKAYNGGTARTVGASYPLASTKMMNQVARSGYIIAAETYYSYKPLMGVVFPTSINLYHENIYLPRFGNTTQITLGT
jgi:Flp pilus assembly protein TadG